MRSIMMRKLNVLLLIIFMTYSASSFSGEIFCPGFTSIPPIISKVLPAPAPFCIYEGKLAKAYENTEFNLCDAIKVMLQKKLNKTIDKWDCNYNPGNYYQYSIILIKLSNPN